MCHLHAYKKIIFLNSHFYFPHSRDEEEDFVFVDGANGEKEPVVFLLGWLGAEDRHLAKYCSIYNQRGFVFYVDICILNIETSKF